MFRVEKYGGKCLHSSTEITWHRKALQDAAVALGAFSHHSCSGFLPHQPFGSRHPFLLNLCLTILGTQLPSALLLLTLLLLTSECVLNSVSLRMWVLFVQPISSEMEQPYLLMLIWPSSMLVF
jgi:hypothetical protein